MSFTAVLSAECHPIIELTIPHARVPKTLIGDDIALFHTCASLVFYPTYNRSQA